MSAEPSSVNRLKMLSPEVEAHSSPIGDVEVTVTGFGGTMMGRREKRDDRQVIEPQHTTLELVKRALEHLPEVARNRLARVRVISVQSPIDSDDLKRHVLMQQIKYLREWTEAALAPFQATGKGQVHIGIFGTDNMAYLATSAHQAIPRTPATHILTSSHKDLDAEDSDAVTSMEFALLYASMREKTRERIGMVCGSSFFAALGLRKIERSGEDAFISRAKRIAKVPRDSANFEFREEQPYDFPIGDPSREFKLEDNLETLKASPSLSYRALVSRANYELNKPRHDRLNALILNAPGAGNLRTNDEDLEHLKQACVTLETAGIPVIVTGDPMEPLNGLRNKPHEPPEVYAGNAELIAESRQISNLIYAGGMTDTDVEMAIGWAVREGDDMEKRGKDLVRYVKERIEQYPFR